MSTAEGSPRAWLPAVHVREASAHRAAPAQVDLKAVVGEPYAEPAARADLSPRSEHVAQSTVVQRDGATGRALPRRPLDADVVADGKCGEPALAPQVDRRNLHGEELAEDVGQL